MKLVLGDEYLSSSSLPPWLAMRHAGVAFEEQVVAGAIASRRVPVLHDGDLAVWDSLAICEHVAERFPEARLWPSDPRDRALARAVSSETHAGFASKRRVLEIWSHAKGPFLFGGFSIADAVFAPLVFRFRTDDVPIEDGVARGWYERMLALPAMQDWERGAKVEVPPSAPCVYAVVFSSQLRGAPSGYEATATRMVELAREQPGFLGVESARSADGFGITVSYWESPEAIRRWKDHPEHELAQAEGRERFYARYDLRVCRVERAYRFP